VRSTVRQLPNFGAGHHTRYTTCFTGGSWPACVSIKPIRLRAQDVAEYEAPRHHPVAPPEPDNARHIVPRSFYSWRAVGITRSDDGGGE